MLKYWIVFALLGLVGPLWAAEKLGADGFPAEWGAQDFEVGEAPVSVSKTTLNKPQTFRVDQLKSVKIEPSGTVPVALPPVRGVSNSFDVSKSYYQPLGAVFGNGEGGNVGSLPRVVSGTGNVSDSKALADVSGFGVLVAGQGGFQKSVWQSSAYAKTWVGAAPGVGNAASGMGVGGTRRHGVPMVNDPALREGWRRLLLSEAVPPEGGGVGGSGPGWLAVRAQILEGLGMHEAAWSLWRMASPQLRADRDEVAQGWARAMLLAGESNEACRMAKAKASARGDAWWTLAVASCAAIEATTGGNANALGLSLQLVPGDEARAHLPLMAELEAVRDGKGIGQRTQDTGGAEGPRGGGMLAGQAWDALAGAVAAAYPAVVSGTDLGMVPDVALRRLRDSAALPAELRISAGRALAEKTGWVADGAALVGLVKGGVISDTTPDAAVVAWAKKEQGSQEPGSQVLGSRVLRDQARLVVRAALRLGDAATAESWWARWRGAEGLDAGEKAERLSAQVGLEVLKGQVSDVTLSSWLAAQEVGTTSGAMQAQRVLLAVEGVQGAVSDTVWDAYRARAVKVGDGADAAWRRVLDKAVTAGDVPQVLALCAEGFAGKGAGDVPPGVAGAVTSALVKIGLPDLAARVVGEIVTRDSLLVTGDVPGVRVSASEVMAREKAEGLKGVKKPRVSAVKLGRPVAPVAPVVPTAPGNDPMEMLPPPRVR